MTTPHTTPTEKQKTERAMSALDTMATTWAMSFNLREGVKAMMSLPDGEDRLIAFIKHCYGEGLYEGRTSHDKPDGQGVTAAPQEEVSDLMDSLAQQLGQIGAILKYPEEWDTAVYPTLVEACDAMNHTAFCHADNQGFDYPPVDPQPPVSALPLAVGVEARDADCATIHHTLMTGLGHNAAIASLERLAAPPPLSPPATGNVGADTSSGENAIWAIVFDDTERRHEIVQGERAARARFKQISDNWNAHLFVKIASNSRDDRHANDNARLGPPGRGMVPMDWQPIETAPKDGAAFLAWWPHLESPRITYWAKKTRTTAG